MDIVSSFCFNKAGQGAFYTGKIKKISTKREFNFAFDCGTSRGVEYLREEIKNFKNNLVQNTLDLLIISHLDTDHVNHLNELLEEIKCKKVIMPYLSPIRRLFLCLAQEDNPSLDYLEFLTDPFAYFIKRDVDAEDIIYIEGDSDDGSSEAQLINDYIPPLPDVTLDLENKLSQGKFIYESNSIGERFGKIFGTKSHSYRDKERILIGSYWEFYFYNKKANDDQIEMFNAFLKDEYILKEEDINIEDIWMETLKEILKDTAKLSEVRIKFKELFKCTNTTGIVVLHGPLNRLNNGGQVILNYVNNNEVHINDTTICKTLLTGDINLNTIDFPQYIKNRLNQVRYFQVPHHGSRISWNKEILKSLHNPLATGSQDKEEDKVNLVINYGVGNTHGHYSDKIYEDVILNNNNQKLYFNTQFHRFEYSLTLNMI